MTHLGLTLHTNVAPAFAVGTRGSGASSMPADRSASPGRDRINLPADDRESEIDRLSAEGLTLVSDLVSGPDGSRSSWRPPSGNLVEPCSSDSPDITRAVTFVCLNSRRAGRGGVPLSGPGRHTRGGASHRRPMTESLTDADHFQLARIAHEYAAGVDDRELARVAALFCADGVLVVPSLPLGSDDVVEHTGQAAIEEALGQVASFARTQHAIVGMTHAADGCRAARGRLACIAHHVRARPDGAVADTWHVIYRDAYRLTDQGWRIARRQLDVQFTDHRPVRLPSRV